MADISLADELNDAVEWMMAAPDSAPPKVDLKIAELLGIAAELRLVPDPEFKSLLKAELLGEKAPLAVVRAFPGGSTRRDANVEKILPTLFGAGYGGYRVQRGNFAVSLALHAAIIAVVLTAGVWVKKQTKPQEVTVLIEPSPYALSPASRAAGGGGGGGDRDKIDASKGKLPRFSMQQITPPAIIVRNEQPKLAAEPTVAGLPALSAPAAQLGDPLSAILQPSNGTGSGGGIGSGSGGGVGSGNGPGVGPGHGGGIGGGIFRVGGGVSAPRPIYAPDPQYSDEARRAKYQGTVLLWVIVGADGKPRDVRVARSLGMGLDERAIEAVRTWKFEPAMKDGQPVAVQVNVEVSFRLY